MKQVYCAFISAIFMIFAVTLPPVDGGASKALELCMQENGVTMEDVEAMYKFGKASQEVKMKPDGSIVDSSDLAKSLGLDHSWAGTYNSKCLSRALLQTDICERGFAFMTCDY